MKPSITSENYEEYLLLSLDGELSSEEEAALQAFLEAHPALAEAVADYEAVKIPLPLVAPVFEGKESLLKPEVEASRKTVSFRPFLWAAAALLLLWAGVRFLSVGEEVPQVAVKKAPAKIVSPPSQPAVETPAPVALSQLEKTANKSSSKPVLSTHKEAVVAVPVEEAVVVAAPEKESISPLPFQQKPLAPLPVPSAVPEAPQAVAVAVALPAPPKTASSGLSLEVPVLEELRSAATEKIVALRDARRSLKETEATVSVGNRALFTIRF